MGDKEKQNSNAVTIIIHNANYYEYINTSLAHFGGCNLRLQMRFVFFF